jgi:hypothetical protein
MRPSSPRFTESRSSAKGGLAQYRRRCSRLLAIDTQLGNKERDADAGINRKPAVLPGEHVGGGSGVEETLPKIGQPSAHLNYPATLNSFRICLKVIDTFRSVFRGEVACRARLGGNEAVPQVISIQRDARGGAAARELRGSREIVIARIAGRQGLCLSLSDRSRPLRKGG